MSGCLPDCPVGVQQAKYRSYFLKTIVGTITLVHAGIAVVDFAAELRVIDRRSALLLMLAFLATGTYLYVRRGMRNVPAPAWRSLSSSDFNSALYFVPACTLSWSALLGPVATGWRTMVAVVVATLLHIVLIYDIILRLPHLATRIVPSLEGKPLSPRDRQLEYDYRRHAVLCRGKGSPRRRARARSAAVARRRARSNDCRGRHVLTTRGRRLCLQLVQSYSDVSAWLSAALASAGLFPSLVVVVGPGPASTLFLLSPFFMIPIISAVKDRLRPRA